MIELKLKNKYIPSFAVFLELMKIDAIFKVGYKSGKEVSNFIEKNPYTEMEINMTIKDLRLYFQILDYLKSNSETCPNDSADYLIEQIDISNLIINQLL